MKQVIKKVKKVFLDESGSPALEYALILGLVGLAIVGAMASLSTSIDGMLSEASEAVGNIEFPEIN